MTPEQVACEFGDEDDGESAEDRASRIRTELFDKIRAKCGWTKEHLAAQPIPDLAETIHRLTGYAVDEKSLPGHVMTYCRE